jgi:hypothetical protein
MANANNDSAYYKQLKVLLEPRPDSTINERLDCLHVVANYILDNKIHKMPSWKAVANELRGKLVDAYTRPGVGAVNFEWIAPMYVQLFEENIPDV